MTKKRTRSSEETIAIEQVVFAEDRNNKDRGKTTEDRGCKTDGNTTEDIRHIEDVHSMCLWALAECARIRKEIDALKRARFPFED